MPLPNTLAAERFEHQMEMLLKDNPDLNQELYTAWSATKTAAADPTADYIAMVEWLCERIKAKAQQVMAADPVEEDEADDWEEE